MSRKRWILGLSAALSAACSSCCEPENGGAAPLHPAEELGKKLFFDDTLSTPSGQECAVCHGEEVGWTGPVGEINLHGAVYPGAVPERFGNRKAPASAYAAEAPLLDYDPATGELAGGSFWDGRATGWVLGNPAADQAMGPFLNPLEQNNPDARTVCEKVAASGYARLFERVWGPGSLDCSPAGATEAFHDIARAIAIYEDSREVSAFSSRYDGYLAACVAAGNDRDACAAGRGAREEMDSRAALSALEWEGLQLFVAKNDNDGVLQPGEGGNCASCHSVESSGAPASGVLGSGGRELLRVPPLFTDFTYDNVGVPRNPENPFYDMDEVFIPVNGQLVPINPLGDAWIDPGLGGFLEELAADEAWRREAFVPAAIRSLSAAELSALAAESFGRHKVPTLRNVDKRPYPGFVKAYFHNGSFKSLEDVVHFYNTRDVLPPCAAPGDVSGVSCWPEPEVSANLNTTELGNLGLSAAQEAAIVAFMQALSDR
ncbi:MAG: hypothetical protein IT372_21910 [Polyangiaceae bacterium]|nr:hypothetical protein [Polyangiaceae bacterium]